MFELFSKSTHHSLINFRAARLYEIIKEIEACFDINNNGKRLNIITITIVLSFLWLSLISLIITNISITGGAFSLFFVFLALGAAYLRLRAENRKLYFFIFYRFFGFASNLNAEEINKLTPILEKIPYSIARGYIDGLIKKQRISYGQVANLYLFLVRQSEML